MFLNEANIPINVCTDGTLIKFSPVSCTGSGANIKPADIYLIEFYTETTIPSGNIVNISPSGYTISSTKSFVPMCAVNIQSKYQEGSQTLIKLIIKDLYENTLKTEYKKLVCSSTSSSVCIKPEDEPITNLYIELNAQNDWEYKYNGYSIAKFVPASVPSTIKIKLPRKDIAYLPPKGQNDQFKIILDTSKLLQYNITATSIRGTVGGNASLSSDSAGNQIIIVDALNRPLELMVNLQIGSVTNTTTGGQTATLPISLKQVSKNIGYNSSKAAPIPGISIINLRNNSSQTYLGQLIYNPQTYLLNDKIIVIYNTNTINGVLQSPLLLLNS